jgi:hypothetical protein
MPRKFLGWVLILHALAHVSAGTWSQANEPVWIGTMLLSVAFAAYLGCGLGLLRLPVLRRNWRALLVVGTLVSIAWIITTRPAWVIPGTTLDVVLLLVATQGFQRRIDADIAVVESLGRDAFRHRRWIVVGWGVGALALVYGTTVAVLRPVFLRWGTTAVERIAGLPGDDVLPRDATYRIDHAITIHAPATSVWPWVVQLGQDRGGFYSYDWLERSVGDDIRNADRIHPEWQKRQVGDTVFATQRDYLGGRLGGLGWRVTTLEPNRVIGLENWGTFVLEPVDSVTTRLIVRTRGAGRPSLLAFVLAPFNAFVFEPAHFIMERGMLRGIRDRAERAAGSV